MSDFQVMSVNGCTGRALQLIADARKHQVEAEGYSTKHDDQYQHNELERAAAIYATPPHWRMHFGPITIPYGWPWAGKFFKPKSRKEDLIRAGALIIAALEKIERDEQKKSLDIELVDNGN